MAGNCSKARPGPGLDHRNLQHYSAEFNNAPSASMALLVVSSVDPTVLRLSHSTFLPFPARDEDRYAPRGGVARARHLRLVLAPIPMEAHLPRAAELVSGGRS